MSLKSYFVMLSVLGATASLQGAVVDATGLTPGSVTTIGAALAGTDTDILVKNTGVYNESLVITRDVDLHGEDPNNRPIVTMLATTSQPALGPGDGVYIGGTSGGNTNQTISFRNFILMPATSGGPTDDAVSISPNAGALLTLKMENVLITPNNGTNQPLATSVWDNPDLAASGAVRIPDDGIYLVDDQFAGFDGNTQVTFKDVEVIGVGGSSSGGDAIVCYPGDTNSSATFTGVGTSYSSRYGSQISKAAPYNITGSKSSPGWVSRKNTNSGIIFFQGAEVTIDHLVIVDNGAFGLRCDADSVSNLTMRDSLIANNGAEGFWSSFVPPSVKSWNIRDTTFYNNGKNGTDLANVKFEAATTADITLTLTDCLIAGSTSTGFENLGAGIITAQNCALVTLGPDALVAILRSTNTGTVNQNAAINADPVFASTATDPLTEAGFDVTAAVYATASSSAGQLNGWGEGPPPASVNDWNLY